MDEESASMYEVSTVERNGHRGLRCLGYFLRGKIQKGKEMTERLQKKVDRAIRLLQSIPTEDGPIEVCYSGGKDSDVILELAKMAKINYRAIYKDTTIDSIGTHGHCREMGVEMVRPKKTFLQLVEEMGMPSRFSRFCCSYLKEYPILPRAIVGIRRDESIKRRERYKEPERCRVFENIKGKPKVRQYLPLLDWTLEDVSEFISERKIKCAPVYYDRGAVSSRKKTGLHRLPFAEPKIKKGRIFEISAITQIANREDAAILR